MNKNMKEEDIMPNKSKSKHVGFKATASKIAKKENISDKSASAILASSTRNASAKAKKANPKLKKVK
jgi:hypothetical protein